MSVVNNVDINKLGTGMQTVAVTASFISCLIKEIAGNDISTKIGTSNLSDELISNIVCNKISKKLTSK